MKGPLDEGLGATIAISPPWTWAGLGGAAVLLLGGLVASLGVDTEITGRARGILRPTGGIRTLTAQVSGTVAQVYARSGMRLEREASVLRLDSPQLRAQLLEADRHLELLESDYRSYAGGQARGLDDEERLLNARLATLSEQLDSHEQSVRSAERKLSMNLELRRGGLISELGMEDSREVVAQARRQLGSVRVQLEQTRQERSSLEARRRALGWESARELRLARSRRDALAYSLDQTLIRAPETGRLEAVLVKPGDAVEAGAVLGKLIPEDAGFQVTAFVPEPDSAFLRVGDQVRLELDQLPHREFGTLAGRISRIAGELASASEIHESMGDAARLEGPTCRIEVQLLPDPVARTGPPLRSGMLGAVRYTLRRQKLITLLFGSLGRGGG